MVAIQPISYILFGFCFAPVDVEAIKRLTLFILTSLNLIKYSFLTVINITILLLSIIRITILFIQQLLIILQLFIRYFGNIIGFFIKTSQSFIKNKTTYFQQLFQPQQAPIPQQQIPIPQQQAPVQQNIIPVPPRAQEPIQTNLRIPRALQNIRRSNRLREQRLNNTNNNPYNH